MRDSATQEYNLPAWGPFPERPGNLTGPESYFEIKAASRKLACVLTSNYVHFASLAGNFTVEFWKLFKLPSGMENETVYPPGPVITGPYRELRETDPWWLNTRVITQPLRVHVAEPIAIENKLLYALLLLTCFVSVKSAGKYSDSSTWQLGAFQALWNKSDVMV